MSLSVIYQLRRELSLRLQPRHGPDLLELHGQVPEAVGHSYELGTALGHFLTLPAYVQGSGGLPATLPEDGYLYRLTSLVRLTQDAEWIFFRPGFEDVETIRLRPEPLADELARRSRGGWLRLRTFATGEMAGPRRFTWWTSAILDPREIIAGMHRLGVPNNWLVRSSVLLRCPVSAVAAGRAARVPTVLDAFESPIFHPTADAGNPASGVTIDLTQAALRAGEDEYVLEPLAVDEIEIWPLAVTDAMKDLRDVRLGTDLYNRLVTYYRDL